MSCPKDPSSDQTREKPPAEAVHPDWESRYREGDTPWEKGAPHPALDAWLKVHPLAGRILVPGCGSGHDVRVLAAAGAEPVGLDLAPSAVETAKTFPRVGCETYVCGDLFALPDEWTATFDGLFEHTCFCAIPPDRRTDYARAVARVIKPGGLFLAVFFLDPDHDEAGPPHGCTREELDALFFPNFQTLGEQTRLPTHPGREEREILRWSRRR